MLLVGTCAGFFWESHGSSATFKWAAGIAMAMVALPFIALAPQANR